MVQETDRQGRRQKQNIMVQKRQIDKRDRQTRAETETENYGPRETDRQGQR